MVVKIVLVIFAPPVHADYILAPMVRWVDNKLYQLISTEKSQFETNTFIIIIPDSIRFRRAGVVPLSPRRFDYRFGNPVIGFRS